MQILISSLLTINVIVSILIILIVLMQRPKNEGLGAAFGGGVTENIFGAQTTNVLAKITRWLGGIFFALTILLSVLMSRQATASGNTRVGTRLQNAPKPPPAATPVPLATPAPAPENPAPAPAPQSPAPASSDAPAPATPTPDAPAPAPVSAPAPAPAPEPAPAPAPAQ